MAAKNAAEASGPRRYDVFNPSKTTPRRIYDGIKNLKPIEIAPGAVAYDVLLAQHVVDDIQADAKQAELEGDLSQLQIKPAGAPAPKPVVVQAPAPTPALTEAQAVA